MTSTPRPHHLPRPTVRACADLLGAALRGPAGEALETAVTGITHDAQAVQPGDLYVGWPGAARHGAEFGPQAARAGAVAVLTDDDGAALLDGLGLPVLVVPDVRALAGRLSAHVYGDAAAKLAVFGVTGTNGKTTTSYLVDGGLRRAGRRTGVIGTVQNLIGDEVVPTKRTTPEAPDLQAILATAVERGVDAVSMEVSSHALALSRTAGIRFEAAAFLNLTQDHLDFHADFEDYFEAKAKLFTPGYTKRAVVNVDDPYGREIAARCRKQGVDLHTFSISDGSDGSDGPDGPDGSGSSDGSGGSRGTAGGAPPADWTVEDVDLGPDGSTFTVVAPDGLRIPGSVRLPGPFNVANALAAIVLLAAAGIDPATAAAGVGDVAGVPGRMERVSVAGQEFLSVVDYAHTPDAVETALKALRPVTAGRLRIVVGCGGDRDRAKRPLMGAAAVRLADEAVFTDDNPRSENSADILAAVAAGADAETAGAGSADAAAGGGPEAREAAGHTGNAGHSRHAEHAADAAHSGQAAGKPHSYRVIADRAEAIAYAVSRSGPGDVLIVAGKGHEQGQETAGVIRPFDDRVVLRAALEAARGAGT